MVITTLIGTASLCSGTTVLVMELRDWQNARDMTHSAYLFVIVVFLSPCVFLSEELAHNEAGNEYFSTYTVAYVCVANVFRLLYGE
jgi:hypothetical protein